MKTAISEAIMFSRLTLIFVLVTAPAALAQELIRHPDPGVDLSNRWQWGQEQIVAGNGWLVWQFTGTVDENLVTSIGQGFDHGFHRRTGLSINARLAGIQDRQQVHRVSQDLLVMAYFEDGKLRQTRLSLPSRPLGLNAPLVWLGETSMTASYRLLLSLLDVEHPRQLKHGLIAALGMHDHSERTGLLNSMRNTQSWQDSQNSLLRALIMQPGPAVETLLLQIAADATQNQAQRRIATAGLRMYGSSNSLELLIDLAENDNDPEVREEAVESLSWFPAQQVLSVLQSLAWFDQSAHIRSEAVAGLRLLRDQEANSFMLTIARDHPSRRTRQEALEQLQRQLF